MAFVFGVKESSISVAVVSNGDGPPVSVLLLLFMVEKEDRETTTPKRPTDGAREEGKKEIEEEPVQRKYDENNPDLAIKHLVLR